MLQKQYISNYIAVCFKAELQRWIKKHETLQMANHFALEVIFVYFTQRSLSEPVSGPTISKKALQFNKLDGPLDFKLAPDSLIISSQDMT